MTTSDGTACPEAIIALSVRDKYSVVAADVLGLTDDDGQASIEHESLGDCRSIVVAKPGFIPKEVAVVRPDGQYSVVLDAGHTLDVEVVDPFGSGVRGIELALAINGGAARATSSPYGIAPRASSRGPLLLLEETDARGCLRFAGIAPGAYLLKPRDPMIVFTLESRLHMWDLQVPRPPLRLIIDDPLVAAWTYLDCTVAEYGYELSAVGGRTMRPLERALKDRFPQSIEVVAVSGDNGGMEPMTVDVVTEAGSCMRHTVPFVRLSKLTSPHQVHLQQEARTLAEGGPELQFHASDLWFDPRHIQLFLQPTTWTAKPGDAPLLKFIRVTPGERLRVPLGAYMLRSRLDCLAEERVVVVERGSGSQVIDVGIRRDFALGFFKPLSRSGRRVSVAAQVFRAGRAVARPVLASDADFPYALPLKEGEYEIRYDGLGITPAIHKFRVTADDLGKELDIAFTVDDL